MYDLVVIGSGPGGYVAAIRAAQLGLKTAIVEKRKTLGGTCLNIGCIPSKSLLQSSELWERVYVHGKEHGIQGKDLSVDLSQMMKRKEDVVKGLVQGVAGLINKNKIESISGTACFISAHAIEVNKQTIESKNFIIATGSDSIELPFLPFDEKVIVSSTGALSLSKVPKNLNIVGAGVIGVELASVYNRLGSKVTIVEMLPHICPMLDLEISKQLHRSLDKQGINFHLNAQVKEAEILRSSAELKFEVEGKDHFIKGDVVLVAVGRKPYSEGLGIKEIGIEKDKRGFISVDGNFRTSVKNIFAIGDVIEGPMLAHRASEEGIAVAELIAGKNPSINYMSIPNVIYTHPEVANVGMTEEEAKEARLDIIVGKHAFRGNPRARCAGEVDGLVKIIGEKTSDRLLGVHIFGPQASEMIHEGVIALDCKSTVSDIASACHAHPTLSEAIKEAALNAHGEAIHL